MADWVIEETKNWAKNPRKRAKHDGATIHKRRRTLRKENEVGDETSQQSHKPPETSRGGKIITADAIKEIWPR